jgi:hypothetical protein
MARHLRREGGENNGNEEKGNEKEGNKESVLCEEEVV